MPIGSLRSLISHVIAPRPALVTLWDTRPPAGPATFGLVGGIQALAAALVLRRRRADLGVTVLVGDLPPGFDPGNDPRPLSCLWPSARVARPALAGCQAWPGFAESLPLLPMPRFVGADMPFLEDGDVDRALPLAAQARAFGGRIRRQDKPDPVDTQAGSNVPGPRLHDAEGGQIDGAITLVGLIHAARTAGAAIRRVSIITDATHIGGRLVQLGTDLGAIEADRWLVADGGLAAEVLAKTACVAPVEFHTGVRIRTVPVPSALTAPVLAVDGSCSAAQAASGAVVADADLSRPGPSGVDALRAAAPLARWLCRVRPEAGLAPVLAAHTVQSLSTGTGAPTLGWTEPGNVLLSLGWGTSQWSALPVLGETLATLLLADESPAPWVDDLASPLAPLAWHSPALDDSDPASTDPVAPHQPGETQ